MEKSVYIRKSVDELTFTDDGMFQAVMREPGLCAELIELLLHLKVGHIEYPELEKTIAPYFSSKGVRLDVYLKDPEKIIDIEMMSYAQKEIGLRSRYYQSMIDMDSLMKGQDYADMKSSYVLFICKNDPFKDESGRGLGFPHYTFTTKCHEIERLNFNDKITKVIYNASAHEKETDGKTRDFLRFAYTNNPGEDDFSKRLAERVQKLKEDEHFKEVYAAMNLREMDIRREAIAEGLQMGLSSGKKQGAEEKSVEAAVIAVKDFHVDPQLAAEKMNAPLDKVMEKLRMP
ncbi:MAG: Rpn family recombination-promoting nuclease/putative transposase [Treponema sp.]|nr:Rpn family recombination-promoting nuclease/putative transposase [Treponema sp.]